MSKNVFADLGYSADEAAGLKLKSYLFMALQEIVKNSDMNQAEIAKVIGADQPLVSKIKKGRFDLFSLERITDYLQKLGHDIHVSTAPCPPEREKGRVVLDKAKRKRKRAKKLVTA